MGATATRTDDGLPKVYPSCKPYGYYTYFTGAGDTSESLGGGDRLLFNLDETDVSKTVSITFNQDVFIKDGILIVENAPFGAYLKVEVYSPDGDVLLMAFSHKSPIFGSRTIHFDSEDRAKVPAGCIFRFTVCNSSGSNGEDSPAAFRAVGRLELYRPDTIQACVI